MNLFICSDCGNDTSLTAPVQPSGHGATCPRRGGHISALTANIREYPSGLWATQCRDGHNFIEAYRGASRSASLQALAAHNAEVHGISRFTKDVTK